MVRRRVTILLLAASGRLYGALLALYPRPFRNRYAAVMRRDFRELSREGLEEGGAELARVWTMAFSDVVLTAIRERGSMLTRSMYVDPRTAVRAMVAVVLVAVTVAMASLVKTPQYEAEAMILVGQEEQDSRPLTFETLQGSTLTLAQAAQTRPVAEDTIERLGLSTTPKEFLERLDAEHAENTTFIEVSYTDPDPARARLVTNTVGEVLSRRASEVSPSADAITANLWKPAQVPDKPMSPNPLRNGLLALVSGLLFCLGLAFALPRVAALGIDRSARRTSGTISRSASRTPGETTTVPTVLGVPSTEATKERELLEALGRRGTLTVAGAALETSLTLEEAERMLSALAAKGHLEVTVEHGRLLYSLWEGDAPL